MELYEHHDNYKLVGRLREDNLAEGEPEDGTEADAAEWELKRKARAMGADESVIEDLDDEDDVKAATIKLITGMMAIEEGVPPE